MKRSSQSGAHSGLGGGVASVGDAARVAQAGRHDGDPGCVVEQVTVHQQPVAQTVARGIVPGHSGYMHLRPGRLADYQHAGGIGNAEDRARAEGECGFAEAARQGFVDGGGQGVVEQRSHQADRGIVVATRKSDGVGFDIGQSDLTLTS